MNHKIKDLKSSILKDLEIWLTKNENNRIEKSILSLNTKVNGLKELDIKKMRSRPNL